MNRLNLGRAAVAGLVGTAVMTMMMLAAPMMGMPPMPIGEMLAQFLRIPTPAGWAMHVMIGLVLATLYAGFLAGRLPGPPPMRGAIFGFAVFLVAQVVVTPMMGGGVFSGGNMLMIGGSLMGHLVYGGMVGAVYGGPVPQPAAARAK